MELAHSCTVNLQGWTDTTRLIQELFLVRRLADQNAAAVIASRLGQAFRVCPEVGYDARIPDGQRALEHNMHPLTGLLR